MSEFGGYRIIPRSEMEPEPTAPYGHVYQAMYRLQHLHESMGVEIEFRGLKASTIQQKTHWFAGRHGFQIRTVSTENGLQVWKRKPAGRAEGFKIIEVKQ